MRVRIRNVQIKTRYRNAGNSWGLGYPMIFGNLKGLGYCIWNRHTGYVSTVSQHTNPVLANREVMDLSRPKRYNDSYIDQDSVA